MRALIMINSGSRFPPDHHALVILHKTYLTEQMRKWPVLLDELSNPEEIKYPHSAMTNQVNIFVNPISSFHHAKILTLNLSHHKRWLSPSKRTATDVLPYCALNMCKLANYISRTTQLLLYLKSNVSCVKSFSKNRESDKNKWWILDGLFFITTQ